MKKRVKEILAIISKALHTRSLYVLDQESVNTPRWKGIYIGLE
jgi:hypothetical protein